MEVYQYKNKKYSIVNDWKTAIGLQAVDGLQPSDYLYELAGKHIEGEIATWLEMLANDYFNEVANSTDKCLSSNKR